LAVICCSRRWCWWWHAEVWSTHISLLIYTHRPF